MPDPTPITFGIITDCQFADADPDPPYYFRDSPEKLRKAIDVLNAHELDFIVNLGDTIDHDLASFDKILPVFDSARAPIYHLLGNHDFAVAPEEKSFVPALLDIPGPPYYRAFSIRGWRFICLDGNQLSLAAHPPGSPAFQSSRALLESLSASGAQNSVHYNGGVGKPQLDWLDAQLAEADSADERAIIFNHFPVLPASTHSLWDAGDVVETLTKHPCAAAHLSGHQHRGSYVAEKDIHYLTLRALLETPDTPNFAIAHLTADHLQIRGYGNQEGFDLPLARSNESGNL